MSETYPKKDPLRNAFRRTYFPSSVGFDCKGTIKFADVQIFSEKVLGVLKV